MNKISIDVVLLPSKEIMGKAIEINKQLLKTNENIIILDKKKCLPHISLVMGCIDENDLLKIKKIIQEASKQFSPLNLSIIDTYTDTIPSGKRVPGYKIEKTKGLQDLHEKIIKIISPYFIDSSKITLDTLYPTPKPEEITLSWIKNYLKGSSFEKFFPHITLGCGEAPQLESPISFTASTLAVCHLGNYCTCREILMTVNLKNKT